MTTDTFDEIGKECKTDIFAIETLYDIDTAILRHPYLEDRKQFTREYYLAQMYLSFKEQERNDVLPLFSQRQIAEHFGIHQSQVSNWHNDRCRPKLFDAIQAHEAARIEYEEKLAPETKGHRIDPSTVYRTFRPLRDYPDRHVPELLATTIANLYTTNDCSARVTFAELHPYHSRGPTWFREIEPIIYEHRITIEDNLNQLLNIQDAPRNTIRIAVVDNVLYLWRQNTDPDHWLNLWNRELIHFRSQEEKQQHVIAICRHLGLTNETEPYITGHRKLTRLLAQFSERPLPTGKYGNYPELSKDEPFLKGSTLYFFLDGTNQSFKEMAYQISHIGFREGGFIHNPAFPDMELLKAQLLATMLSDAHLDEKRVLYYSEKDDERRQRVKNLLGQFGDVQYNEEGDRLRIPVPIGRLLESIGMPVGDKAQQQIELPKSIQNGSDNTKIAYLQELIPEDGSFSQGMFSWSRSIVLVSPSNATFEAKLNSEQLTYIRKFGTQIVNDYGIEDSNRRVVFIKWSTLNELANSTETNSSSGAKDLINCITANPCKLIHDEVELAKSLGIEIDLHPNRINIFEETGRVSVQWIARTIGYDAAIRWALLAPPNDKRKRNSVAEWITEHFLKG